MVRQPATEHQEMREPQFDAEVLIGRLVDGEATDDDRYRFERIAGMDHAMWRTLALRQLDMQALADRVASQTEIAERVEVGAAPARSRIGIAVTFSGWAAAAAVALWWALAAGPSGPRPGGSVVPAIEPRRYELTPEQHLQEFLRASPSASELEPLLLDSERLEDGRYGYRILRRIEEYVISDVPPDALRKAGE